MTVSTNASRLRRVSRAFLWMSIRSVLGNWIARHNQLLRFRSNGQRLERSQVPHPSAFCAHGWDSTGPLIETSKKPPEWIRVPIFLVSEGLQPHHGWRFHL